ncbi:MAG: type II toxin-antitoxin system RelE/ParE family toxin [Candidatus Omnitrophota bacterium]
MKVSYNPAFLKDIKSLRGAPIYEKIKNLSFFKIPQYIDIKDIPNLVKITKSDNAYRIRVGDYRIGVRYRGDCLIFVRCLHRKEIYRYFP